MRPKASGSFDGGDEGDNDDGGGDDDYHNYDDDDDDEPSRSLLSSVAVALSLTGPHQRHRTGFVPEP